MLFYHGRSIGIRGSGGAVYRVGGGTGLAAVAGDVVGSGGAGRRGRGGGSVPSFGRIRVGWGVLGRARDFRRGIVRALQRVAALQPTVGGWGHREDVGGSRGGG